MKKIFIALCCVMLLLSLVSVGYSESDADNLLTDGFLNGHYIVESIQEGKNSMKYFLAMAYISGVIDAIDKMGNSKIIDEFYGGKTQKAEIAETICRYYQNNPSQQYKPVIDTLLSGAK